MKKLLITILLVALSIHGAQALSADSIRKNVADLDSLIQMVETNYAGFPLIIQKGYGSAYQSLKNALCKKVSAGEMGIEEATCEYCYWFFSQFDGHVYVDHQLFFDGYFTRCHIRYAQLFEYAPKPVSCKVDDATWLIRVPSCNGQNPTYQWLSDAAQQYLQSGCDNLIIDVRGNTGGGDAIWEPLLPLLYDHQPASPEYTYFRNTPKNLSFYQRILNDDPDDEVAKWLIDSSSQSPDEMVAIVDEEDSIESFPVSPLPKKAAIVIDKSTASSAETLVRFAKMCCDTTRTKVYGKENTWGAQYSGNIIGTPLPNSQIWVYYPTCISSLFLSGDTNGSSGLIPDVRIELPYPQKLTDNCDEWILWIAKKWSAQY